MAVLAQIKFSQAGNPNSPGTPGLAFIALAPPVGPPPAHIIVANGDNTNVARWTFYLLDAPLGSALTTSSSTPIQDSTILNTLDLGEDPILPGTYRIKLVVKDTFGNQSTDIRDVVVPTQVHGFLIPGFLTDDASFNYPDPTPVAANRRGWMKAIAEFMLVMDAFSGGLTAPVNPTDDGKFAAALAGDLVYITGATATSRLNVFTDLLKGLAPASGGGTTNFLRADATWAAPPPSVTPPAGGDDYKVAYAFASNLAYASGVLMTTTADGFAFGGTVTTGARQNYASSATIAKARNNAGSGDVTLQSWASDRYAIGDSTNLAGLDVLLATGGTYLIKVNGTTEYSFSSTVLDAKDNAVQFGTNPSLTGLIRAPSNTTVSAARNSLNSADINLIATDNANTVLVGSSLFANGMVLNVAAGNVAIAVGGSTEYAFSATSADWAQNGLDNAAYVSYGTGTKPGTGATRLGYVSQASGGVVASTARIEGDTQDAFLVRWNAEVDTLKFGDFNRTAEIRSHVKTGGVGTLYVNNVLEYSFSSTILDFKDNRAQFGTNPSGTGLIAVPHNSVVLAGRDSANAADVNLLRWGIVSNVISFGSSTVAQIGYNVTTGGIHGLQVNSVTEYQFDSVALTMNGNNLLMGAGFINFGTVPATTGSVRLEKNTGIYARNSGNTNNSALVYYDSADNAVMGDATQTANTYLDHKTGAGGLNIRWNAVLEYVFTSTVADFKDNILQFGTNPASSQTIRMPNNTGYASRNNANSNNITTMFLDNADGLLFGIPGAGVAPANMAWYVVTGGAFSMRVNSVDKYIFDANKMFVADSGSVPSSNPAGGGYLYSEGGAGKWRGSSGTVTTFGSAEPHCPRCDRDFALEWESETYGKLSVCVSCLTDALMRAGVPANDFIIERRTA